MLTNFPQGDKFDFLFGWWYRISAPPKVLETDALHKRELVRKGKLTSIALLIGILILLPAVEVLSSNIQALIPLIINLLILGGAVILNRSGKIFMAGLIVVIVTETAMGMNVLMSALQNGTGLISLNLPFFELLMLPELLAVSLLPAWTVFLVATINSLFTIACIAFLPKSPELVHILASSAAFGTYYMPTSLQFAGATMSYLWVTSAMQEMKRADQAEEINKLMQELTMHQQAEVQKKHQLEESIQEIVSVHAQVANGKFDARVPLHQKNVLWSIAGSLNNLLARLQRWQHDVIQLQYTDQAILQLLSNIQMAKKQGIPLQMYKTGTRLDPLIAEISRGMIAHQVLNNQPASFRQFSDPGFYSQD